ncbi:hypothetical protein IQ215_01530 [Cyanobacterium stanieri LEGE 03274]|uniref:Uncharacterized protein n=1 Tax=Cyanobacterium stanieri LEGE 03274 TaxID=1828756 RepID=A0ABR9V0G6_9CHRO|nr:hypothetical protein [Cyanobacterium stanieri]MBE9221367.1 hypothetical protein [Cyanobacterium stanieri LEGE 03274]
MNKIIFSLILIITTLFSQKSYGENTKKSNNQCNQEITELADKLVNDISDYGNRVIQKSRRGAANSPIMPIYIITAGQWEMEKLPLSQRSYGANNSSHIEQIFFTTRERQYLSDTRLEETNNYHWLLLTPTNRGWDMVMLLTRFGEVGDNGLVSPVVDTTSGVVGEAVRLWLRDCRFN